MSIFSIFKTTKPAPPRIADSQKDKDKSVAGAGNIYYVKWTDRKCTMSDVVKFYNEHEAQIYIADCRESGYYVQTWHESRDAQVAAEVAKIKYELEQMQQTDIARYKRQAQDASAERDLLRTQVTELKAKLDNLQRLHDQAEPAAKAIGAEYKARFADVEKRAKETRNNAKLALRALDLRNIDSTDFKAAIESADFAKTREKFGGNLQAGLVAYFLERIYNGNKLS